MPELSIYNVWGPTETSIVNTMHRITEDDITLLNQNLSVPVGREHAMMPIRIWNSQTKELITSPNEQGEILMLGDCVSLGYLGDPERTAEAYVEYQNQRAYRTGDIGYFDGDGNLFIVGRIGTAVKVNGYRVDLMEVDAAACSLSDVHLASAFLLQSDESDLSSVQLCMAVEPKPDCKVDIFQLKQSLRALLPPYMVPKRVFIFESLPKNSNGKLDRRTIVADVKSRFNP
jgi:acyl-coenzyme A synthetase/AMP-(fatty) acid ligase